MSTFKNKNSLRTIEAQIAQKLKNIIMRLGQNLLVLIKKKRVITKAVICMLPLSLCESKMTNVQQPKY